MTTKFPNKRLAILLVWLLGLAGVGSTPATELLSVVGQSVPPMVGGNSDSTLPLMSSDGRFVLFVSAATDLVASGTNAPPATPINLPLNVFLRDRSNAVTTLVSLNPAGTGGGNANSFPSGISSDGRFVLFESAAGNLISGDNNGVSDVLVRDMQSGSNSLVSVSVSGSPGNASSYGSVLTPDGRYVAFTSAASDLVPGDINGIPDIFVRDRQAGATILVSVGATSAGAYSASPQITVDGRYVAFFSTATNLVPSVPLGGDIYVRDLALGTTIWASAGARSVLQAAMNTMNATCLAHVMSGDGKFIAYEIQPTNLTANSAIVLRYGIETGLTDVVSTNAYWFSGAPESIEAVSISSDGRFIAYAAKGASTTGSEAGVYVWDALFNTNILASCDMGGVFPTNTLSYWPMLTPDAHFVSFQSTATNLVTNVISRDFHLYVRDLQEGTTQLVDRDTNGASSASILGGAAQMSDDGRWVAFEANDSSLVAYDNNRRYDVFVRDLAAVGMDQVSLHDPNVDSQTPDGISTVALSSISGDARFVVFSSVADNLVPNDTNQCGDIFLRDLVSQKTFLVSANASGSGPGNGVSTDPVLSADGRYVAFTSIASDLVAGDTNKTADVFVRDMFSGTTVLASVTTNGVAGNGDSTLPVLSRDGQAMLFHSSAGNLARGATKGRDNLYWRDLAHPTIYTVYSSTYTSASTVTAMSADGRLVVYAGFTGPWYLWDTQVHSNIFIGPTLTGSAAILALSPDGIRIVNGYNMGGSNLFLFDRDLGTNKLLGLCSSILHGTPRFSADGRYLAYVTATANVPTDLNGRNDVYLYDSVNDTHTLVSHSPNGQGPLGGDSDSPDISADGRWVVYRSAATNIVPVDVNGVPDVFVWDRLSGTTTLLSVSSSGLTTANNRSLTPFLSADGAVAIFASWASDMVARDFNQACDLFAVSMAGSGAAPAFRVTALPGIGPNGGIWLTWPILPNKIFQVQFKNAMEDANWQTLAGNVTIEGGQGYLNDPTTTSSQRFYRILAQ